MYENVHAPIQSCLQLPTSCQIRRPRRSHGSSGPIDIHRAKFGLNFSRVFVIEYRGPGLLRHLSAIF